MGPTDGERRLHTAGELVGLDRLGGSDHDQINQIPDPRVFLATGQCVGMQLLREVLGNGVDREFDRSDSGELKQVRPAEYIRRIHEGVSTREVKVKRPNSSPATRATTRTRNEPPGAPCSSCATSPNSKENWSVVPTRAAVWRKRSRAAVGP